MSLLNTYISKVRNLKLRSGWTIEVRGLSLDSLNFRTYMTFGKKMELKTHMKIKKNRRDARVVNGAVC